jgi:hypothetical protein
MKGMEIKAEKKKKIIKVSKYLLELEGKTLQPSVGTSLYLQRKQS